MMKKTLREQIEDSVLRARDCYFEDGMISYYEREIHTLYADSPWDVLTDFFQIVREKSKGDVLRESLKILARLDDEKTLPYYNEFIKEHLKHPDIAVRDGALTSLEYIECYENLPVLLNYFMWEKVAWLRIYAWDIIKQLAESDLMGYTKESISVPTLPHIDIGDLPLALQQSPVPAVPLVDAVGVSLTEDLVISIPGRPPVIKY